MIKRSEVAGDSWTPFQDDYADAPDGLSEANLASNEDEVAHNASVADMTEFVTELDEKGLSMIDPETGTLGLKGGAADLLRDFVNRKAAERRAGTQSS